MVVVALVGRELYESSKSKESQKCPFCPYGSRPFEIKRDNLNETQWEKSRCGENPESSKKKIGYEYVVGLAPGQTCCSLAMWRYKNPFVIWVRCYMKSNKST